MGDGDQILHQFLFRTKFLGVHHEQFTFMGATQVNQQCVTKAGQSVLMGQNYSLNLPVNDGVYHAQKLLALKVQSTTDFHDPLIDADMLLLAPLFKHCTLMEQSWLLSLTGNTTVSHCLAFFLPTRQPKRSSEILIRVVASIGDCPFRRQYANAIPFLDSLDGDADLFRELRWCIHCSMLTHIRV